MQVDAAQAVVSVYTEDWVEDGRENWRGILPCAEGGYCQVFWPRNRRPRRDRPGQDEEDCG